MSELPLNGHGDDFGEAGCRKLLEMHQVRRRVERGTFASGTVRQATMAVNAERTAMVVIAQPEVSNGMVAPAHTT